MNDIYFEEEITLSHAFKLWDRGDGIGEISLFNTIIGYIHGDQQLSDGYHYDEDLEQYVEDTEEEEDIDIEYTPISCFPGHLSSGHTVLQPFSDTYIDCIEHLTSLVTSLPQDLLPEKPKGSIIDVFSGDEKFLISRDFDIDVVRFGKDIDQSILDNITSFSHYMKNYLHMFPEVKIMFLSHSYINGNIYVQYQLDNTYFLSVVFDQNNKILVSKINKSGKFNNFNIFNCDNANYQTICESVFSILGLSLELAKITLLISKSLIQKIPKQKNIFFNDIIKHHSQYFLTALHNRGVFLLHRDLNIQDSVAIKVNLNRPDLLLLQETLKTYDISIIDGLSLFMNYFLHNYQNVD